MHSTRPSDDELFMRVAREVATRSLCDRDQVGAVIVDAQLRITGTGRNGPPRGFDHREQTCTTWCKRASSSSEFAWTHGPDAIWAIKLPDIIIDNEQTILRVYNYLGYVDIPMKTEKDWLDHGFIKKERTLDPSYADCPSLHAEVNALLSSDRTRHEGGTIYITSPPCWSCGKMIANSGLRTLVVEHDPLKFAERSANDTYLFMESVGITVVTVETKGQDK